MPATAHRPSAAAMIVLAIAMLMTGCTPGTTPAASPTLTRTTGPAASGKPATASFSGVWSGIWTRVTPPRSSGTYRWVPHQRGHRVTGTLEAGNSACRTKGPLTGHVSGQHIVLHAVTPPSTERAWPRPFATELWPTARSPGQPS
jgi:hypothetical protein